MEEKRKEEHERKKKKEMDEMVMTEDGLKELEQNT